MLQQTTHCLGQFINICGFMYRDAFDDKPTTPITKASLIGRSKKFFFDECKLFYGSPFIEKLFWAASLITKVNPEVRTPFIRIKFWPMRSQLLSMEPSHWSELGSCKGCPQLQLSLSELRQLLFIRKCVFSITIDNNTSS